MYQVTSSPTGSSTPPLLPPGSGRPSAPRGGRFCGDEPPIEPSWHCANCGSRLAESPLGRFSQVHSISCPNHLSNIESEHIDYKRLRQPVHAAVENATVNRRVLGAARNKQHLNLRPRLTGKFGNWRPSSYRLLFSASIMRSINLLEPRRPSYIGSVAPGVSPLPGLG